MARRNVSTTKVEIVQVGVQLMLEKGYAGTTIKEISEILNISKGNITFYFPTKEHLMLEFTKEIFDFHTRCIERVLQQGYTKLMAYCWEIVAQIALCEDYETMKDIYLSLYSHSSTLEYVKDWVADKNYKLLKDVKPDWTVEKYRMVENVASCIERSALTEPCTENYTFRMKVELILDSLLKLYDVAEEKRNEVIDQILHIDYRAIGKSLHQEFIDYTKRINTAALEAAMQRHKAFSGQEVTQ